MKVTLTVWRQAGPEAQGRFETYEVDEVSEDMSFLELFDVLNERLSTKGEEPIAFDHDCREGICGSCSMMINGRPHGPELGTATCQLLIPKAVADTAMDAAQCIGCGACVAACPNGAAQLFTAAKVMHLNLLPQGQPERWERVTNMVHTMEDFFGSCTNHGECEAACPKEISIDFIALMNRDYIKAQFKQRRLASQRG